MSFSAAKLVPPKISRYFRRPTLGHRKLKYFQRFLRLGCQKWLGRWKLATKILPRRCTHARPSLVTHAHSRVPEITLAAAATRRQLPSPCVTTSLHHVPLPPSIVCCRKLVPAPGRPRCRRPLLSPYHFWLRLSPAGPPLASARLVPDVTG
jgi:hypothetical protein